MEEWLPLRLAPGADLRAALQAVLAERKVTAAFVVAAVGSLRPARLRLAGADGEHVIEGDSEILTLSGTLSPDGPHLHISVADAQGRVFGGHVLPGCTVRTTAEVLLALLPQWHFERRHDVQTGFAELALRPRN